MRDTEKHKRQPRVDEPKNVREEFGLPMPKYEDERSALLVDREALRALV